MWKIRVRILTSVADPSHVMQKLPTQVSNWPQVKSDQSQGLKLTSSDSRLWNTVDQGDSEHRKNKDFYKPQECFCSIGLLLVTNSL